MTSLGVSPSVGGLEVRYWRPLMFRWIARSISARTRDAIELSAVSAEAAALLIASPPVLTVAVSCAAGAVPASMPPPELHPRAPALPGRARSKSRAPRSLSAPLPSKSPPAGGVCPRLLGGFVLPAVSQLGQFNARLAPPPRLLHSNVPMSHFDQSSGVDVSLHLCGLLSCTPSRR